MQRIEAVETELAATKKALAAAVVQPEKTGIAPRKDSKGKERSAGIGTTPSFTPKRHRSSPGDERQAVSKKPKNVNPKPADEVLRGGPGDIPWQEVRNKKKRGKQESARKQRPIRKKAKCEAVVVKTSEDTYAEVLRAMRTDPQLKEFSADVQKIRRTQTGDMLIELKKDSVNKSSTYKELTERVMGEKVQVKAMCPEVTLQLRDLDWITTEEEVRTAIKEQCDLETVQMTVRLRRAPLGTQAASIKLPVDAANKALEVGKIRVGCSVCPLKISQRPEGCYRCLEYGHLARNCEGPDRNDITLVVIGDSLERVEVLATEAVDAVENWMYEKKLVIAHQKTELLLISNRKVVQKAEITVGEHTIASKRELKHLGVMIDDRLNFNCHVDYACEKAARAVTALSRIMPNNSAICSSKRRLLSSVATSILRYASPAWGTAMKTKRNRVKLSSTYRLMAMRVASAYRTI
ncbi:uncharacterized protein Dwil_GK28277, partial [Drosophila willistoni]